MRRCVRRLSRREGLAVRVAFALALALLTHRYFTSIYHPTEGVERGTGKYRPYVAVQDGHKIYLQVMSVVFDRDLDITNEVERFGYPGYRWQTESGRPIYPHAFGPIMVWAPTLAIAHGVSKVANLFGAGIADHGYTLFHQRFVLFSSVLFAWLTAVFGFRVARRVIGGAWAPAVAALGILLGTNLSYYATQRPDYGHAMSAFVCALFLGYWALTVRELAWRRFVWLGVLLGACALVRTQNILLGIVVAVEIGTRLAQAPPSGEPRLRFSALLVARGLAALGVCLLAMTPQFLVWNYHYESGFFSPPHGTTYVHLGRPMVLELLYSPLNGFFYTHPLAEFSVIGLLLVPKRVRLVGIAFLVAILVQVYVNSCVYDWWGMGSYGARRMCCTSLILMVGLASLLRAAGILLGRTPVHARRAFGIAFVGWFAIWSLCHERPARRRTRVKVVKMCCDEVPDLMGDIAEPIWDRYGNPFAFPANLLFKLRWDVPLEEWEKVVIGVYAARPKVHDLVSKERGKPKPYAWNIPGVNFSPFLGNGFGPRQKNVVVKKVKPIFYRWTTDRESRIYVPLFLPCAHRFQVPLRPNLAPGDRPMPVAITFNGKVVWEKTLQAGWTSADFLVPASEVNRGTNVMSFRSTPGPCRACSKYDALGALHAHSDGLDVGLAIQQMKVWVIDPHR